MGTEDVGGRQYAKRMSIFSIYLYGFLQQCLRDHVVLPRHAPIMGQRTHYQVPCVHAVRCLALSPEIFRSVKLGFDRCNDGLGDFVVNSENVS